MKLKWRIAVLRQKGKEGMYLHPLARIGMEEQHEKSKAAEFLFSEWGMSLTGTLGSQLAVLLGNVVALGGGASQEEVQWGQPVSCYLAFAVSDGL